MARFDEIRTDPERHYLETIDQAPSLAARVRSGRREERLVGTNHMPRGRRPSQGLECGPGHHGRLRALRFLVDALDEGLSGRRPLGDSLASYEEQRNAEAMPMFDFTCQLAALEPPPPEMQQLLAAVHGNPEATDAFLGLIAGTTPFPAFFDPVNIGRVMAEAQGRSAAQPR